MDKLVFGNETVGHFGCGVTGRRWMVGRPLDVLGICLTSAHSLIAGWMRVPHRQISCKDCVKINSERDHIVKWQRVLCSSFDSSESMPQPSARYSIYSNQSSTKPSVDKSFKRLHRAFILRCVYHVHFITCSLAAEDRSAGSIISTVLKW